MINGNCKIVIERRRVLDVFEAYVKKYNIEDEKIRLKAEHTYRVSALCEQIAKSIELSDEDVELAWFLGMLHDIGRFEQVKRYGTFMDAQSVNHAEFGAALLFDEGLIKEFADCSVDENVQKCPESNEGNASCLNDEKDDMNLIRDAIAWHSAYRLPETMDERTRMFCDILRDADKVDILRVNVEFSFEDIYNVPLDVLRNCEVADAVMHAVDEQHAVFREWRKTPVDYLVGHICLVYEMVYPETVREVVKQGYLNKLLNFESENEKAQRQFREIRNKMERYLSDKIS